MNEPPLWLKISYFCRIEKSRVRLVYRRLSRLYLFGRIRAPHPFAATTIGPSLLSCRTIIHTHTQAHIQRHTHTHVDFRTLVCSGPVADRKCSRPRAMACQMISGKNRRGDAKNLPRDCGLIICIQVRDKVQDRV